jgi:hypothetical protein
MEWIVEHSEIKKPLLRGQKVFKTKGAAVRFYSSCKSPYKRITEVKTLSSKGY